MHTYRLPLREACMEHQLALDRNMFCTTHIHYLLDRDSTQRLIAIGLSRLLWG
jgi:hypothetical protein